MALDRHDLALIIGGRRFMGWLDVRVSRGIERAAGDFQIGATQRWPGLDARFEVPEGEPCEVFIGDEKVMTGYVDSVVQSRDSNSASVKIGGRSKTADLVDCSPDYEIASFAGLDLAEVARRISAPFKIDVVARASGPTYAVAAAHKGETAWKVIERLARQRQVLVTDDAEGRLVLTRLATEKATDALVHPSAGLLQIETKRDAAQRFSVYRVKAQAGQRWSDAGTEGEDGEGEEEVLAHVEGVIFDRGVRRYRPKTILSEGAAKKVGALERAEYEARRNIGKALRVVARVVGWRQSDGKLWTPNTLVPCSVPSMNLSADLAIAEVHYSKSGAGTTCQLELAPPEAFTPEPGEVPAGAGGARWNDAGTITHAVE